MAWGFREAAHGVGAVVERAQCSVEWLAHEEHLARSKEDRKLARVSSLRARTVLNPSVAQAEPGKAKNQDEHRKSGWQFRVLGLVY